MEYEEEIKFICLLERVSQPLYMGPKGHGSTKYLYNLPPDHLEPYQQEAMIELRKTIPESTNIVEIPVNKTSEPYDLTYIQKAVPKDAIFGEMNEPHLRAAAELTKILMMQPTRTEFFNASALCRDSVNTHLWVHAYTKAILHRPDMKGFRLPAVWEIMPDLFLEGKAWKEAVRHAALPEKNRPIIVVDKGTTGSDLNPNHKLSYFMEDMGVNSHHWHWHILNPFNAPKGTVDRKGETFYYMHHEVLARYDAERLGNGLNRVVPFDILQNDMIEEGYYPKLTIQSSARNFAGRQENTKLRDVDRTKDPGTNRNVTLSDIRMWLTRIIEAIDAGFAIKDGGGRIDLRNQKGIDVVTSMWESSFDSPHRKFYGIPHNLGHTILSCCHDPDWRHREQPGVMFLIGTSMRDPIFYRWHKFLELICQRHKDTFQPYTHEELEWTEIKVNEIEVIRGEDNRVPVSLEGKNKLVTFWMQSDVELSRGLDFGRTNVNGLGSVWARITHLQHLPFIYRIKVTSQAEKEVKATVRIFMAPKFDENGDVFRFYEQRNLFFEMDKFTTTLHPGKNVIIQKSVDSTLTIPWAQTFRDLERDTTFPTREQVFCGCGWPHHLLLPRGTTSGMTFELFVMLTDFQIDEVPDSKRPIGALNAKGACRDSVSYCGLLDEKYPDSRSMGYPFDRQAVPDERLNQTTFMLSDFVTPVSNMTTTEVKIFHVEKTILRGNGAPDGCREVYVKP